MSSSKKIIKKLEDAGFVWISCKGDHHKYRHPDGRQVIVVHPRKDFPKGTFRNMEKTAGMKLK
jgi:predicted RNA binding protein YcfA (HicA-like mRNA interferase family)